MGAIFSKLTRPAVTTPDGQTQYFDNSAQATQGLASGLAKTAQPTTSDLSDLRIAPDSYSQDDAGGPLVQNGGGTVGSVRENTPVAPQLPKMVTPSFAEASGGGTTPLSNQLTTKGKLLSLLLVGSEGASRAAAASLPINGGHTGVGLGPALESGFATVPALKQQQNILAQQGLEQDKERAQIAALPLQAQTELALKQAQTTWYNQRGEAVGEHNLKAGDTLVDKNGNVIQQGANVKDAAQAKQEGKTAGTINAVTNAGGTPAQILSALGVKNPTDKNTNSAQLYLDANNGDPGAAIKAMNADHLKLATGIHTAIAQLHAPGSGLTPAQQRQLNSDPEYAGLRAQQSALSRKLGDMQSDQFADPKAVSMAQQNAAAVASKMSAVQSRVFGGGGSATVRMTGPKGTFDVPADKVALFKQNGYN